MSTSQSAVMLCDWRVKAGVTYYISREAYSRGEMYIGHARLCACVRMCVLSVPRRIPTLLL